MRVLEINGKRYTFFIVEKEDQELALNYTKGDESRKLDELTLVKPHFKSDNHPVWYELTVYDEKFKNMRILARIQVDPI